MAEAAKPATGAKQQPSAAPVVLEERNGSIATIRLNRPERLNALNIEMGRALVHALLRASQDNSVRAVVVTGAGRGFCAGGDVELLRDLRKRNASDELKALLEAGKEICLSIATMTKPVIAAVNGPAAGGGMNLALAADIRVASDAASFTESFAKVGLYPDFGGTYFLPRIVGPALSAELFYTAETLSAADALRLGIVNRVFSAAQFEAETQKIVEVLAGAPTVALRDVKRTIVADDKKALEMKLDEEIRLQIHCFQSEDCLEGLNAFFEKRKPNFKGH
ncbi:MAG TPA: enoyl-CoA hydratase [Candidatus Acidoferrales bacterium]|jgi:2-(1,2-epoxy-1,2-dihydrophenyl)acetyl-CoA isomerase|nr:enoyl-CoA hydratase [Candidatus Acidoferrales bacterium]